MASLIKSIALKNFKGFSDEVRIDLRPITLLFGANSAGKSSILQALQYVREILERGNANPDRTLQAWVSTQVQNRVEAAGMFLQ